MVSFAHRRRKRRPVARLLLALGLCGAAACSRKVELANEQSSNFVPSNTAPLADSGIPLIADAGLHSASFAACGERPEGDCRGGNDFPCNFVAWLPQIIDECQARTGCRANDWLSVDLESGCATAIGMVEPNQEFVACLAETFGAFRCPCLGHLTSARYLGVANNGCLDASSPILR